MKKLSVRHYLFSPVCTFALATAGLAIFPHCGGDPEPVKDPTASPPLPPPADTMGITTTSTGQAAVEPPPAPPPAPPETFTDDQILGVIHTVNTGELAQAKLAKSKAKDKQVKRFAEMMDKHHTEADKKALSIGKKNGWKLEASPTGSALESDAKNTTASLSGQSAADFDKAYMDAQVKTHEAVIETLDKKLMPNAKGTEVKAYVEAVRTKVAAHLKDAKDLQAKLK